MKLLRHPYLLGTVGRRRRVVTMDGPLAKQAIAAARLGLQQAPIGTERLAHGGRVNLKRVFHDDGARPDTAHQLVLGDEFTGRLGQNFDHLEGAPTNGCRRSEHPKFVARKVNHAPGRYVDQSNAFSSGFGSASKVGLTPTLATPSYKVSSIRVRTA